MRNNSKKQIFETASNLFSEFGFLGISMEDIAKCLKITKAALYYHFKSKKELYLEVLEKSCQDMFKAIKRGVAQAETSEQKFSLLIQNYLYFGLKEKTLIKSSFLRTPSLDCEITAHTAKLRKNINSQFQNFLKEIFQKEKLDLKLATLLLLGAMDRLILETALFNKKLNVKKETAQILKVINPASIK